MFAKTLPLVLLIEDSPHDIDFARRALARCGVAHRLVVAEHADEALALLTGTGLVQPDKPSVRPDLVLLDLNLPGTSGREVLRRIKSDPALCTIPVVVLSTSQHPRDIESSYQLHANSYHVKCDNSAEYQNTVQRIAEYWLGAAVRAVPREPSGVSCPRVAGM